jgi:hypothetical protein
VHGADEAVRVLEVVDELHADAGHAHHVQHDGAGVGQLDAGRPGGEVVAGRRHQVGDDVHGLADRGAAHALLEERLHLRGGAPVVVDAPVLGVAGGDDGALLGAGGVLVVAAGVVAALAGRLDLAGLERLLHQTGVVGRVDDLDPLDARELRVVPDVLADAGIRDPRGIQCCLNLCHRCPAPSRGSAALR